MGYQVKKVKKFGLWIKALPHIIFLLPHGINKLPKDTDVTRADDQFFIVDESSALDFLLVFRLQISNDYFPYAYLGKDRYLAVLSPTYLDRWDYNKSLTFFNEYTCDLSEDSEQNIGTLKELKQWCKSIKQLPK
ncbi:hypothetical protein [Capnocytophaga sputigena]|uniref:hypothetical protein n=1 Tax=Capnocytophaga sputigena TaxID=1019 RepID=UPI0028D43CDA|nr:hypothetical protein [Capnocytophaga sputigena]